MFNKFEDRLMAILNPLAQKINANVTLSAISEGFLRTTPITIGIAVFAIIGNLPVPSYTAWLASTGLKTVFDAVLGASTNVLSLYISFSIAYCLAKKEKQNALTAGFLSMASFIILMPQTIQGQKEVISGLATTYLGADGMLIALLTALLVGHLYCWLVKKNILFKMPDSVPAMVSESLSPVFVAMLVFGTILAIRIIFFLTPFKNIFTFMNQIISIPLMNVGASVPVVIFILFLANFLWFFGIHPNTIQGPATPILTMALMANIQAYQQHRALPYLTLAIVGACASLGGNGNTLGLLVAMMTAKSKRYKSMLKLSLIPNLFNVNEPLIFGMPLMLNPLFFIPMTLSCVAMGIVGLIGAKVIVVAYNPLMGLLPWTTPFFIKFILAGGFPLMLIITVALVVNTLIYWPFFKVADQLALKEEAAEVKGATV